jgi:hypothetical protein
MNLVSFDIGIKNMAYCIFNVDSGCASCTAWNAMNLMPAAAAAAAAAAERPSCSSCKRKAKYKKDALFFCEAHAKRSDTYVLPDNKEWTLPALRKKKVDELRQLVLTKTGVAAANKDACLQILQQWMTQWVLEPAVVVSTLKKKSANDADLIDVGRQLCWQLDAASLPERIDMVIIENQISPLAARMRTLQGMVTQYFILRYPDAQIQYVSSSMKLKAFSTPVAAVASTAAQKYKQHKVDGVAHCAAMLRANATVAGRFTAETLLSHAKKDDLADCWLQALWFLKHVGKINWSAEDLKIKCVDA